MKVVKMNIIFIFLFSVWIDAAISRSPVKGSVKSRSHLQTNQKKLNLDLSTDGPDPSQLITQIFLSTMKELKPQIHRRKSVSIFLDVTAPPGSRLEYLENIESTLRRLLQQIIPFPMQSFIRTRIQGNDDGTIATLAITVSILPTKKEGKDFGSINVDLSKRHIDILRILRTTLTMAVQDPSIRDSGDQSNHINLEIIPPYSFKKSNVQEIIETIESILITLLPEKEFSIKATISEDSGIVTHISCIINIGETAAQNNAFSYNIDISKIRNGLGQRITDILQHIQRKVDTIFNERKPVLLSLKIKPLPRSNKDSISTIINTIMSTLKGRYPNRIELTVNIYENSRREINLVILDIIIEPRSAIEIDFTIRDSKAIQRLTYEISKLKTNLIEPIDKSTSFTLILQPPANTNDEIIENITHIVISVISRIFPENEIRIQAKTTKDNRGIVSKITMVITLEPNSAITDRKEGDIVYINLSKPDIDLTEQITNILPSLKNKLNRDQTIPVTLTLNITPPEKSTEVFIRKTLTTILLILSQNFPQDRIKSEATAEQNPLGYLDNVKIIFTIIPGASPREPTNSKIMNINLIDSGDNLVSEILNILPKLNKFIQTDETATLSLNIQPPRGANDEKIKNIVKSVIKTISENYPYNTLEFQVKVLENPRGTITNVTILVTIGSTNESKTKLVPKIINLNLTIPGKNIITEISHVLPVLKTKITENQEKGVPTRINLKINPPTGITTDYVKKTSNTILTIISKLFPQNQVTVKAKMKKNPQGKITEIILIINIEPNPSEPNTTGSKGMRPSTTPSTTQTQQPSSEMNLDLSKPGTDITEEIETALTKIKVEINLKQIVEKKVNFVLNIQPPNGTNQQFVENTVNTVLTTLKTLFPNDRIEINLKVFKNKDRISKVTLYLVISPMNINPEEDTTTESDYLTTPTSNNLPEEKIDLSNPETNIAEVVKNHIIEITSEITKNNPIDQPVNFKLKIQPPTDSSEEYVKKTVSIVMTTISDLFPQKTIQMNLHIIRNPDGRITTITMVINIESTTYTKSSTTTTESNENTETDITTVSEDKSPSTPSVTTPIEINLDLTKPGTTTIDEIVNILPNINEKIRDILPKGKSVQLEFNINPSDDSSKKYVKTTVDTIVTLFKTAYPDNKIDYKVKVLKNKHSKITKIILNISISPNSNGKSPFMVYLVTLETPKEPSQTTATPLKHTTPKEETPTQIELDLSKPGSKIVEDVLTIIPNIEKVVDNVNLKKKPINIEIVMKPPIGSTEDTITQITQEIVNIFEQKFPNEKMKISLKIKKVKNNINKVLMILTIEPTTTETNNINNFTTSKPRTVTEEREELVTTTPKEYTTSEETTPSNEKITGISSLGTTPQRESITSAFTKGRPTSEESTSGNEETTKSFTVGTTSQKESFTITSTREQERERTTSKEYTSFEKSTPGNVETTKSFTSKTTSPKESFTVTPAEETQTPIEETSSEETNPNNKEVNESFTSGTTTHRKSFTVTPTKEVEREGTTSKVYTSSEESTSPDQEITKSFTSGTTPQKESFVTTTTRETITPKIYTSSGEVTPSNEEITKSFTGRTTSQKESFTVTPVEGKRTPKEETFSEETTPHNKGVTEFFTRGTTTQRKQFTVTPTEEEGREETTSKEHTSSEESTPRNQELTKSFTSETTPQKESFITTSKGKTTTPKIYTSSEEVTPSNEEITKSFTSKTTSQKESYTVTPEEQKQTPKEYTSSEEITPNNKEITKSFTSGTTMQRESFTVTPTKEERREGTTSQEHTSSEESTPRNEEITKSFTSGTTPQRESFTYTPAEGKQTPKEETSSEETTPNNKEVTESFTGGTTTQRNSFTTTPRKEEGREITTSREYTSSEESTPHNKGITKSFTSGTTPQKESFTFTPAEGKQTPKEETSSEETTPNNKEVTESFTSGTTTQRKSFTTTPRKEEGREITTSREYTSSEESTSHNEEITKSFTSGTSPQKESFTTTSTRETIIPKIYTSSGEVTPSNEEITKSFTSRTTSQKELFTVTPAEGKQTPKEITYSEETTPNNEDVTKFFTSITTPGRESFTVTPTKEEGRKEITSKEESSSEEATPNSKEVTKSFTSGTTTQRKSFTLTPTKEEGREGTTSKEYTPSEESTSRTTPQKESFTSTSTREIITPKIYTSSGEVTPSNEEITESFTSRTTSQKESFTVTPAERNQTPKEYTSYKETTPSKEKITVSFTSGTTPQRESFTVTPTKTSEKSTPGNEEITKSFTWPEEYTPSNEEITESSTETIPGKESFTVTPKESTSFTFPSNDEFNYKTTKYIEPETVRPIPTIIPTNEGRETTVTIDLSKPGTNLQNYIEEIIPSIIPNIRPLLEEKEPISLTFKIKPPKGSTTSYMKITSETLANILTKYFPDNKMTVKISGLKNPQGYVSEVTILVVIGPSTTTEYIVPETVRPITTTTPSTNEDQETTITIDLSKPGTNLQNYIDQIIPSILPNITPLLDENQPVSLTLKIKPPKGSTTSYMKITSETLVNILTKYFPNNKITVKISGLKNPQGYVSEVTILVVIGPSTTPEYIVPETVRPITTTTPSTNEGKETTITIDLSKPGTNLQNYINEIIPSILPNIRPVLDNKQPVSLTFKITPPNGSTTSYIKTTSETLVNILNKFFPYNKISVKISGLQNPQGYISEVTIIVDIEPPSSEEPQIKNIDIDLSKPGTTLTGEVTHFIPSILPSIKSQLTKSPVTINFVIKPPRGSSEDYLQTTVQSLGQILTTYFPENKITVQVNAQKNPQGYITEITVYITIQPSTILTPKSEDIDIDLSKPGVTLVNQINKVLPTILPSLTKSLNDNHPVSLSFRIKPRPGMTESYIPVITQVLNSFLTQYFPKNKININVKANKNPQGYLTEVIIGITIQPPSNQNQPPENNLPSVEDVDVDLSKPGTNLINVVNEKIPSILKDVREKLSKKQTTTINFKIKPPTGSTDSYLQPLGNSLMTILSNYFPENKINVKMSAQKNTQGYISEVTIEIIIQPTLTTPTEAADIDIDLTKPGVTLPSQLEKILPNIRQDITKRLDSNHPVSLSFKIKPPKGSTQSYLQVITTTLQSVLVKYFPNNKISVEISAQQDSQGTITEMIVEINLTPSTIQPPNDEDVDIDLSKPGVTLTNQISIIVPHILPNVTKNLSSGRPVTLTFKIKPPSRATDSYLQVTAETLQSLLAKYFPNNQISVEISAQKNSQNVLTLISIQITIQPSLTPVPNKQNPQIDMSKPGMNLVDQISQYLTTVSSDVTSKISSGQPVNITLDIKPPYDSTDSYIQMVVQSIVPALRKYFPNYKVNLETSAEKDSQGYITVITLLICIEPASNERDYNVDIDLQTSKFTLVEQVDNILPNILQKLQNDLDSGESVTLNFKVIPPNGSQEAYLQTFTQDLVPILTKFFPGNRMSIKASAEKNSQGFLINITISITIQASAQIRKIDIDLSRPGNTLQMQVSKLLPSVLPELKTDLIHGKPITLSFNIRPPMYSTRSFQSQIANQLVQILPQYFPNNRMSIKTSSQEDANGYISDIVLIITISP